MDAEPYPRVDLLFNVEIALRVARNCMDAIEAVSTNWPEVEFEVDWHHEEDRPCIYVRMYHDFETGDYWGDETPYACDIVNVPSSRSRYQIECDLRSAVDEVREEIRGLQEASESAPKGAES